MSASLAAIRREEMRAEDTAGYKQACGSEKQRPDRNGDSFLVKMDQGHDAVSDEQRGLYRSSVRCIAA